MRQVLPFGDAIAGFIELLMGYHLERFH